MDSELNRVQVTKKILAEKKRKNNTTSKKEIKYSSYPVNSGIWINNFGKKKKGFTIPSIKWYQS